MLVVVKATKCGFVNIVYKFLHSSTHIFSELNWEKRLKSLALVKDRDNYKRLQSTIKEAEKLGVSKLFKSSAVTIKHNLSFKKPID